MLVHRVEDPGDPRLSAYRGLGDARLLRDGNLFVAEGRGVVERVLADRRYSVRSLLLNAASLDALRPVLASAAPAEIFECPTPLFRDITGFNLHRGCLALVQRPRELAWVEAVGDSRLVVVLEGMADADNVGSVFRNARAFSAGAVLLSPTCCDPLYRKAVRTSMGHVLTVPFARLAPWPASLSDVKAAGFTLAALTPREPSQTLQDCAAALRSGSRTALLFGTEGAGLTEAAERAADIRVRIPIDPGVDSLNVAVASGIALSRLTGQF